MNYLFIYYFFICFRYEIFKLQLTCHVEDAITGADMGQEGVSQPLARMGIFHQASNVNNIKECWDFAANQEVKVKTHSRFSTLIQVILRVFTPFLFITLKSVLSKWLF